MNPPEPPLRTGLLYGSCVNYIALERVSISSGDTRTFPCTAKGWKCETNLEYEMGILMI